MQYRTTWASTCHAEDESCWPNLPRSRARSQKFGAVSRSNLGKLNQVKNALFLPSVAFHLFDLVQPSNVVWFHSRSQTKDPDGYVQRTGIKGLLLEDRGFGFKVNRKKLLQFHIISRFIKNGTQKGISFLLKNGGE